MAIKNHTFEDDGRTYYYMHRHLEHFEKDAAISLFQNQKKISTEKKLIIISVILQLYL